VHAGRPATGPGRQAALRALIGAYWVLMARVCCARVGEIKPGLDRRRSGRPRQAADLLGDPIWKAAARVRAVRTPEAPANKPKGADDHPPAGRDEGRTAHWR